MSNKKETAVYWLIKQMSLEDVCKYSRKLGVAKKMETQQIIEAFWNGDNTDSISEQNIKEFAEQYYNETYEQ